MKATIYEGHVLMKLTAVEAAVIKSAIGNIASTNGTHSSVLAGVYSKLASIGAPNICSAINTCVLKEKEDWEEACENWMADAMVDGEA